MPWMVKGQNELGSKQDTEKKLNELEAEGWILTGTHANNQGFTKEAWYFFHKKPTQHE